jgi:hypothetical protein
VNPDTYERLRRILKRAKLTPQIEQALAKATDVVLRKPRIIRVAYDSKPLPAYVLLEIEVQRGELVFMNDKPQPFRYTVEIMIYDQPDYERAKKIDQAVRKKMRTR